VTVMGPVRAVGTASLRSSLRIENALTCHAVICALVLSFPFADFLVVDAAHKCFHDIEVVALLPACLPRIRLGRFKR
jgi:hypothetical protein